MSLSNASCSDNNDSNNPPQLKEVPLLTEEPVRREWLKNSLVDLNKIDSTGSTENNDTNNEQINTIIAPIPQSRKDISEYDSEEDDDDELKKVTEANRHIEIDDTKSDDNQATTSTMTKPLDNNESEYERVVKHYNSVKKRQKREEMSQKSYKRKYLVACDFSDESLYAMEWAMGTMLRDSDELHIVTVSNHEDNPEVLKQSNISLEQEVNLTLEAAIKETKKRLVKMMLYDIKIVFHAMIGRVKDAIKSLIYNIPLTMVVCGCRGRGTMKGMIMGSVSTYLVHKSIVPVTVVRRNKKKKVHRRHLITATPLSESVRTGNLQVDELKK
ncbi:hypothetical protein BJ944DRAFT_203525 [Cunninghamella echinulata]|nr:hypothetical protein BJ944DRAFT_203525 [Cunninghamella echinulata]